jgi:hypothetical protein
MVVSCQFRSPPAGSSFSTPEGHLSDSGRRPIQFATLGELLAEHAVVEQRVLFADMERGYWRGY